MTEAVVPVVAILILFIGLPWLIFHYVTRWKQASTLTLEDENLLDELHDIARRLDERLVTVERIIAADRDQDVLSRDRDQDVLSRDRDQSAIGRDRYADIAEFRPQAVRKDR